MQHLHISMISFISLTRFNSKGMDSPSDVKKYYIKNFFFKMEKNPHPFGSDTVFMKQLTIT